MLRKKGRAKALIGVVIAVVMSLSLVPASSALALGELQEWQPPTEKSATSYTQDGKTYTYITSSAHKVTESTADVLGISNVTICPSAGNGFTWLGGADAIYDSIKTNARFGIYGTDVNQNMNPYYANYFYNQYQQTTAVGGTDLADPRDTALVDAAIGNPGPMNADATPVTEFGTPWALYYRPDILFGVSSLKDSTGAAISYGAATSSVSGYTEQVNRIRNKELGQYEGLDLYQPGDEDYDPYYVNYDMTSYTGSIVDNLYSLANAAEAIMQRTAETDNPKVTRYEDPLEIAANFEAYLRGTQYAVLKAIDEGTVQRKTVGIVKAADTNENTVTFMPCNIKGKDTNDYPEFLEAVTDNICDVNGLVDGVGHAQDLLACDVVYLYGFNGTGNSQKVDALKDNLIKVLTNYGVTDESQYPEINVQAPKTVLHHDRGGSVENTVLLGSLIGYAYPTVVNPVYSLAYFYENFYHIKTSRLQDALGMNLAAMSLPAGTELSLEGYDEADYDAILDEGIQYYLANKADIDATYPKLAAADLDAMIARVWPEVAALKAAVAELPEAADATSADGEAAAAAQAAYNALPALQKTYIATDDVVKIATVQAAASADAQNAAEEIAKAAEEARAQAEAAKVEAEKQAAEAKKAQEAAEAAAAAAKTAQEAAEKKAAAAESSSVKASVLKVTANKVTAKAKKKTTIKASKAFKVTGAAGKLTYAKLSGSPKITVSASGKVKVGKGLKKGKTFKVKVLVVDTGNAKFAAGQATVTLKVKIK